MRVFNIYFRNGFLSLRIGAGMFRNKEVYINSPTLYSGYYEAKVERLGNRCLDFDKEFSKVVRDKLSFSYSIDWGCYSD